MIRFKLVQTVFAQVQTLLARFQVQEREDPTLARFGQLEVVRQTSERPPVPLFLARKPRLA